MDLDRLSILGRRNGSRVLREVALPEWGCTLHVRGLTAGERDYYELEIRKQTDEGLRPNVRGLMVALATTDEYGESFFRLEDAADLARLDAAPVDRLFSAAVELSGMGPSDLEDLEKNSRTVQPAQASSG
jgi:hypothetical protein